MAVSAAVGPRPVLGSSAFEMGGAIVAYEVRGSGPVAVAVPYLEGFDRTALRALFRPLERFLSLVYLDPPGVGRSGAAASPADLAPAWTLRAVEHLRSRLEIDRVGLVAHGSGGRLAVAYAAGHRDATRFLVLTGASAANEFDARDPSVFEIEEVAVAWQRALKEESAAAFWAWHRALRDAERDPGVRRALTRIESESAGIDPARLSRAARDLESLDVRPLLALVRAPALVVAGGEDRVVPERLQGKLAGELPGAKYVAFPRSGHYPMLQERARFLEAVRRFLRTVPR